MDLSTKDNNITSLVVLWGIAVICLFLELICYGNFLNSLELGTMIGSHVGKAIGVVLIFSYLFLVLKKKIKVTVWRLCLVLFTSSIFSSCFLQLLIFCTKDLPQFVVMQQQVMLLTADDVVKKEDAYFVQ